ncbi:AAA family ATPase, partial [Planococcus sp. SIMBA_143]
LLPSAVDLVGFSKLLNKKVKKESNKHYYFDHLLNDLKDQYDFIIIDVPPTLSEYTNNALVASNYSLIIMQSEPDSLTG